MEFIYSKYNESVVIEVIDNSKGSFDFVIHKENELKNIAYIYTTFFDDHIAITDCISLDQRKGYAEALFEEMLSFRSK